jgi:putative endonuclease
VNHVRNNNYQYVYVLKSLKSGKWYIGCTNNLRKRFMEHQNNESKYTKGRGPFELIYYEASFNELDGFAREKYLKTGMGRRYLKNRMKRFLFLT